MGIREGVKRKSLIGRKKKLADLQAIGARIRQVRGKVLQEEFATVLGVSQGQLSKIERGKLAPTVEVLLQLVARFGKSADWILTGED